MTTSPSSTPVPRATRRRVLAIEPIGGGRVRYKLNCGHSVIRHDNYKALEAGQTANCTECGRIEKAERIEG
jgi:hypothetical protein